MRKITSMLLIEKVRSCQFLLTGEAMNFSSDNIELFLAVLDRGSFSAAARALRRVPSAVSMGIANMEAELGFQLFDRSHREPVPTALALALAPPRALDCRAAQAAAEPRH
ncbi:putative DNA-binding transcriptional regulator [Serratia fonticola]|uniref:Putative DNA-binding transcriptional regulator n=1 Tax=Serratia fonticola TaxID=47917 RepID=A0A4U9W075_SERFO|nr:putative DNA-binding transcriptional regulator [Serratia fonticola]